MVGRLCVFTLIVGALFAGALPLHSQEEAAPPATVKLKDGSVIHGTITGMNGGELLIDTGFGGTIPVNWEQVADLSNSLKLPIQTTDGSKYMGTISGVDASGNATINADDASGPISVPLTAVAAFNPPPDVTYKGFINAGASIADGNTRTKTASANAEFVARSKRQRLTLRGSWNYAEDNVSGLTARNTRGQVKYDFFWTDRFYTWISAFFEGDRFQNLSLRTALSAGLGYQWVNAGDFEDEWLEGLEVYTEAGIAFFNEDYRNGTDDQYVSGRWALKVDWPIIPDRITLFHFHEGYPSLENGEDIYILSEQGVRMTIWENFIATFQVNWRWDNTPSQGFRRSDTLYIATLGYTFSF